MPAWFLSNFPQDREHGVGPYYNYPIRWWQNTHLHYSWTKGYKKNPAGSRFALCIENRDCEDLEKRKIYKILPDEEAAQEGYLRVVDESGEDYLYPESYFIVIELTCKAREALAAAG